jgi:ABC-type lipoprotein export system ATPase subunit
LERTYYFSELVDFLSQQVELLPDLNIKNNIAPMNIGHINGAIDEINKAPLGVNEAIIGTAKSKSIGIKQQSDIGKICFKLFLFLLFIL